MSEEVVTELGKIDAPYGRKILLENVDHASGMSLLRLRIREGVRFTVLEIDEETALQWSALMVAWASKPLH